MMVSRWVRVADLEANVDTEEMRTKLLSEDLERKEHLIDLDIGGSIKLEFAVKK